MRGRRLDYPTKRRRGKDYLWLAELKSYEKLTEEELDIAVNGIPFEGDRYPLNYIFWKRRYYTRVKITLTGETGTVIGACIWKRNLPYSSSQDYIVKIGNRITCLAESVLIPV